MVENNPISYSVKPWQRIKTITHFDSIAKDRRFLSRFQNFVARTRMSSGCSGKQQWHGAVMNAGIFMKRGRVGERREKIQREELQSHFTRNVRRIERRMHLPSTIRECIYFFLPRFFPPSDIEKFIVHMEKQIF